MSETNLAKEFEGKPCPYEKCQNGKLKVSIEHNLLCLNCNSTFHLTYVDDFEMKRRIFLAERRNPEFFSRLEQLESEGKDALEKLMIIEKEGIPLYCSPAYIVGYKDHKDFPS